jgi:hypothetical protein
MLHLLGRELSPAWDERTDHTRSEDASRHQGQGHGSEYNSEADDISEGVETGRVSAYDLEIAKHRGNSHAHITPDGVAMRRCRSLASSIPREY